MYKVKEEHKGKRIDRKEDSYDMDNLSDEQVLRLMALYPHFFEDVETCDDCGIELTVADPETICSECYQEYGDNADQKFENDG